MGGDDVRTYALVALLVIAAGLISVGVSLWSVPAGLITSGVLLAVLAVLFLLDVPARVPGVERR